MRKLEELQKKIPTDEVVKQIDECNSELEKWWSKKEHFWFQRSRVQWLLLGDKTTKFFHQKTLQRRQRNRITRLLKDDEEWLENEKDLAKLARDYFKKLFGTSGPKSWENALQAVHSVVDDSTNAALTMDVTDDAIKKAFFQMGALKAPGPDGFNGLFYQRYWEHVGQDVTNVLKVFFFFSFWSFVKGAQ